MYGYTECGDIITVVLLPRVFRNWIVPAEGPRCVRKDYCRRRRRAVVLFFRPSPKRERFRSAPGLRLQE